MAYRVTTTGRIRANHVHLAPRDGAAIVDEATLTVTAIDETSIVMTELRFDPDVSGRGVMSSGPRKGRSSVQQVASREPYARVALPMHIGHAQTGE
jgi:hypothetical protein